MSANDTDRVLGVDSRLKSADDRVPVGHPPGPYLAALVRRIVRQRLTDEAVPIEREHFLVLVDPDIVADGVVAVGHRDRPAGDQVHRHDGAPLDVGRKGIQADEVAIEADSFAAGQIRPVGEAVEGGCPLRPVVESNPAILVAEMPPLAEVDVVVDAEPVGVLALELGFVVQMRHREAELHTVLVGRFAHPAQRRGVVFPRSVGPDLAKIAVEAVLVPGKESRPAGDRCPCPRST
jgi:hypothetical protein